MVIIVEYINLKVVFVVVPVPSQVIVGRTISKKQMLMSVCTKIGIQINVKLGGEAWAVEIPVSCDLLYSLCIFYTSYLIKDKLPYCAVQLVLLHNSVTFRYRLHGQ